jgi:hypothetical protein
MDAPIGEIWQVEVDGSTCNATFDELTARIADGSLLRIDRVRKGNLRWIEAGKVPVLVAFFNARDESPPISPSITTSMPQAAERAHRPAETAQPNDPAPSSNVCSVHPDVPAAYACDTCGNAFCRTCPNSYGSVKICPFCGAMCKSLAEIERRQTEQKERFEASATPFGFGDFGRALAHPFKFKLSLFFGALMFAIFSIAQSAMGFGGSIILMASAIICVLLTNMLTFGVLANTVDNFSQGKLDRNFMPTFDDFALWDDVVHPFFLSIGVYISSFGPFIAVVLVAVFMVMGAVRSELNSVQADAVRSVSPQLPYAANATRQSEQVRELLRRSQEQQRQRIEAIENESAAGDAPEAFNTNALTEEQDIEQVNEMMRQHQKAQLESMVGKAPETIAAERDGLLKQIVGYGVLFLLAGGITLLWGLFYFPAACAVAGYTRSFAATINPTVGLDTIKRLGGSYVLILVMGFILLALSGAVDLLLSIVFLPFAMPTIGNLPAKFIGSMVGFYFSVVFSCIIGYALYRAADRLKLYTT